MIEKKTVYVPSSDGIHRLAGVVYLPQGKARGLFHVVHGMTEHMERYDRFLTAMAERGWISFGYDHLGHGKTASDDSELGYIAKERGWELLVKDVKVFSDAVRREFGDEEMPYYLMGHSMGSFVSRLAAQRVVSPRGLILMGTGGSNPAAGIGLALIGAIKKIKGDRHVSSLIDTIAFGSYNKRFGGGSPEDPKPWLTTDEAVRRRYYADPFCMFPFTVSAMGDLVRLIQYSNDKAWYRGIPKDMPVLLVSGEEDPVGNYGKGVREVEAKLRAEGISVSCRLYPDARHEILNDFTYETVACHIAEFCDK